MINTDKATKMPACNERFGVMAAVNLNKKCIFASVYELAATRDGSANLKRTLRNKY